MQPRRPAHLAPVAALNLPRGLRLDVHPVAAPDRKLLHAGADLRIGIRLRKVPALDNVAVFQARILKAPVAMSDRDHDYEFASRVGPMPAGLRSCSGWAVISRSPAS